MEGIYGDIYGTSGKFLMNDGVDDNKVYIETHKEKKNRPATIVYLTTKEGLRAAVDVLSRTESNGAKYEECAILQSDGTAKKGNRGSEKYCTFPTPDEGKTVAESIHSHGWSTDGNKGQTTLAVR